MSAFYTFDERVVLRTPRYPLSAAIDTESLPALLQDNAFLEAVYLASPVLYDACMKWKADHSPGKKETEKLFRSLLKYYVRMSSRCTPFGLFSGCAVANWAAGRTAVTVKGEGRHTRLDMHYLCALSRHLSLLPGIRGRLLYFPNSSVYTIGNELRYVEYTYQKGKRIHQISAVSASPYLQEIMHASYNGATTGELCALLSAAGIDAADAHTFVDELVQAQVLVSEMEPAITGKEFLHQLLMVLERLAPDGDATVIHTLQVLREVEASLQQLDAPGVNEVGRYRHIMQRLDSLEVEYEEGKLFQADMTRELEGNGISFALQQQLMSALEALNRLTPNTPNPHMEQFIRSFRERYEEKEMPLLEVLDTEAGIGYATGSSGNILPLVDDLAVAGKETDPQYTWGRRESMLQERLLELRAGEQHTLEIKEEDLQGLSAAWNDLPPSLALMFRIVAEENDTIYLENVGGSSAVNLLGRFAHADPAIRRLACDIASQEQRQAGNAIYAEVVHLPESRTANVLLHPVFREYEIPYLAKSSVDKEQQIDVQDLYVSVKHNRVVLFSRRLGREVIPRLSNAHNYAHHTLPLYRFLCDLQLQGCRPSLAFSWGSLEALHRFLPRVTFRNTILHLARWVMTAQDVKPLINAGEAELPAAIAAFRGRWRLPRNLVLADGDNEWLIDLENPTTTAIWLDTVKGRNSFILREFINDQQLVSDKEGRACVNQLLAVLHRQAPAAAQSPAPQGYCAASSPQRRFIPGSEWLYYKLYCGVKMADRILSDALKPLCEKLEAGGLIDKWFFVRYNDPDFHIRLRFHAANKAHIVPLMNDAYACLEPLVETGYIHRLQLDTYNRELERYGSNTIELAETLFCHDSIACISMLELTGGDERENLRWLWALRAVDALLTGFGFTPAEKLAQLAPLRDAYAREFNMDKPLRLQLDDKYRQHRESISQFMTEQSSLTAILDKRSAAVAPVTAGILELHHNSRLQVPLSSLLSACIHMMLNRIILADARKHEMVIYDFLGRYYTSAIARERAGWYLQSPV